MADSTSVLTLEQCKALNDWGLSDPALQRNVLVFDDEILLGNLIDSALSGSSATLEGLSDVTFTSLTVGDNLIYNGTVWANQPGGAGSGNVTTSVTLTDNSILRGNGTQDIDTTNITSSVNGNSLTIPGTLDVSDISHGTSDLTITSTAGDIIVEANARAIELKAQAGVLINDQVEFLGASGVVQITPGVDDIVAVRFRDSSLATKLDVGYSDLLDVSFFTTTTDISIQSTGGDVVLIADAGDVSHTVTLGSFFVNYNTGASFTATGSNDTASIFSLNQTNTNPGKLEFKVGDRDPRGVYASTASTLSIVEDGQSSDILFHVGAASDNTSYVSLKDAAVLTFGAEEIGATTTTKYLYPNFSKEIASTSRRAWPCPREGFLTNLHIYHEIPAGNDNSIVYTVRVNAVSSALAVTLGSNTSQGANVLVTNFVPVSQGDLIDIQVTKAADVGVTPTTVIATMELV